MSNLSCKALSQIIATDESMRVIDLSHNMMTEQVIKEEMIGALKLNKTLTNLDIRENPGYSNKAKKLIALCLLRNIDNLKNAVPPIKKIEKSWLNPALLIPVRYAPSNLDKIDYDLISDTSPDTKTQEDEPKSHKRNPSKKVSNPFQKLANKLIVKETA